MKREHKRRLTKLEKKLEAEQRDDRDSQSEVSVKLNVDADEAIAKLNELREVAEETEEALENISLEGEP